VIPNYGKVGNDTNAFGRYFFAQRCGRECTLSWLAHVICRFSVPLRCKARIAKNHELLQLNRDNSQWLERHSRLERELAQARQAAQVQQPEVDALRLIAVEHRTVQVR